MNKLLAGIGEVWFKVLIALVPAIADKEEFMVLKDLVAPRLCFPQGSQLPVIVHNEPAKRICPNMEEQQRQDERQKEIP